MLIASRHPSRHAAKVSQPSPLFVRLAAFANYESTKSFSNLPSQDIVPDTSGDSAGVGGKIREVVIPLNLKETYLQLQKVKKGKKKGGVIPREPLLRLEEGKGKNICKIFILLSI